MEMSTESTVNVYSTNPGELPQTPVEAVCVDPDKLPWVDIGMGICFKVVSCCNKTGRYVLISKYPAGTQIPPHRHSGQVTAITLQGSWKYLEQDFVSTKGRIPKK
jgi:2,4'-dihydroxyacetophenone dioxygenase